MLKQYCIDYVVFERSNDFGGLWRYREDDYGVMDFTYINVSKYNYCYSDHSFDRNASEYPHHTEMFDYIKSYVNKYELFKKILFKTQLVSIEGLIIH